MLKVENKVKRGRPSKKQIVGNLEITRFKPQLVRMDNIKFDDNLFVPMKTGKKIVQVDDIHVQVNLIHSPYE